MSLPTEGPLIDYLRYEDPQNSALVALDAYGTTRPALVSRYHADYTAALEAAVERKFDDLPTGPSANVFVYGGSIDITGLFTTDGPNLVVNQLPGTPNDLDVGHYYRIVGNNSNEVRIAIDDKDPTGAVVRTGDAVVVRQASGYKTLDVFENTKPDVLGTGSVAVEQVPLGVFNVSLTGDAEAAIAAAGTLGATKNAINETFNAIFARLRTVANFMGFVESAGILLDSNGDSVSFSNQMQISALVPTTALPNSGIVSFPTDTDDLHLPESLANYTIDTTTTYGGLNVNFTVHSSNNTEMQYKIVVGLTNATVSGADLTSGATNGTLTFSQADGIYSTGVISVVFVAEVAGDTYSFVIYDGATGQVVQMDTFIVGAAPRAISEGTLGKIKLVE